MDKSSVTRHLIGKEELDTNNRLTRELTKTENIENQAIIKMVLCFYVDDSNKSHICTSHILTLISGQKKINQL